MTKISKTEVSRHLERAGVTLIDQSRFAKLSATAATAALTQTKGPVEFVDSFAELTSAANIRDKLLKGIDVSRELEFNGIELSDEEIAAVRTISPVLTKIDGLKPVYPWLPVYSGDIFTFESATITRCDYKITKSFAEKIWKRASAAWAKDSFRAPTETYESIGNGHGNNYVYIRKNEVAIGCQVIPRDQVEAVARHYGWEPNVK